MNTFFRIMNITVAGIIAYKLLFPNFEETTVWQQGFCEGYKTAQQWEQKRINAHEADLRNMLAKSEKDLGELYGKPGYESDVIRGNIATEMRHIRSSIALPAVPVTDGISLILPTKNKIIHCN